MTVEIAGPARAGPIVFVLLSAALSWSIWILAWFATGSPASTTAASAGMIVAIYVGSFAPAISAAFLLGMSQPEMLRDWLRGFIHWRCGWRAYAAALLPFPVVLLLLTFVLGYLPRVDQLHGLPKIAIYLTVFPVSIFNGMASIIMGAGPLGEEGGWRGYLLPQLLKHCSEARASLVIGSLWALWHLPLMAMFADWRSGVPFAVYLPLYTVGVIGLSFVMSRVWFVGGGSLVPCIWLHGLVNAVGGVAFDHRVWTSRWSAEASIAHFAIATILTAAFLFWSAHRKWSVVIRAV